MPSAVLQPAPADNPSAVEHFAQCLAFETDCADVHQAFVDDTVDFVLLDVRRPALFAAAHVPGAVNLPYGKIIASKLEQYSKDCAFVVYCAGPHCNGAHRAALRLARLQRPVKLMIGGISGWREEGFELVGA